jgi:hypothetical protein
MVFQVHEAVGQGVGGGRRGALGAQGALGALGALGAFAVTVGFFFAGLPVLVAAVAADDLSCLGGIALGWWGCWWWQQWWWLWWWWWWWWWSTEENRERWLRGPPRLFRCLAVVRVLCCCQNKLRGPLRLSDTGVYFGLVLLHSDNDNVAVALLTGLRNGSINHN